MVDGMKNTFKKGDRVRVLPRTGDSKTTWCDEMLEMVGKEYLVTRVLPDHMSHGLGTVYVRSPMRTPTGATSIYVFQPESLELIEGATK